MASHQVSLILGIVQDSEGVPPRYVVNVPIEQSIPMLGAFLAQMLAELAKRGAASSIEIARTIPAHPHGG